MTFVARALSFSNCLTFLEHLLLEELVPVTVLVCQSREALLAELQSSNVDQARESQNAQSGSHYQSLTIRTVASSSLVRLVYVESLLHARAYLSTLYRQEQSIVTAEELRPMLAVWGLIDVHKSTGDYTAQGLFRSLSLATDVAHYAYRGLVIAESSDLGEETGQGGLDEMHISCWDQRVPLLTQSIRFEGQRQKLAGTGVTTGDIVRKWCILDGSE